MSQNWGTNLGDVYPGSKPYKGYIAAPEVAETLVRGGIVLFSTFKLIGVATGSVFQALFSLSFMPSSKDKDALDILDMIVPLHNCMREMGLYSFSHHSFSFQLVPLGMPIYFLLFLSRKLIKINIFLLLDLNLGSESDSS